MIFSRLPLVRYFFGETSATVAMAQRWRRAFSQDPELANDLIRIGGILTLPAERQVNGEAAPDPVDPYKTEREQGARVLAIKILALGGMTTNEMKQLMETPDEH